MPILPKLVYDRRNHTARLIYKLLNNSAHQYKSNFNVTSEKATFLHILKKRRQFSGYNYEEPQKAYWQYKYHKKTMILRPYD